MSETRTPEEALLNFANWTKPIEGGMVGMVYGLTSEHAFAVLDQLAAAEQARDEAVRENARLREGIKRVACDWDRKSSDVYGLVAGEDGKAIRAVVDGFSALLAQPEEVKDGT